MLTLSNGLCSLKGREALRNSAQHLAQRAQHGLLHQGVAVLQAFCDDALQAKRDIRIAGKIQRQRALCMWTMCFCIMESPVSLCSGT